ncbi:MAG TPA: response regulator [Crenotrichaceae bacterium]|nr:response regulator [Crenotrichaceae bacterium]
MICQDGASLKLLIADDDRVNCRVLKGILLKDGYQVVVAENGFDAVALFEKEKPDMVLLDVMMPVMNGYEAAREIKSRCSDHFVPVIFLTALTDKHALSACIEAGGDDFLTKPYHRTILKAKIDAMERIRQLYDKLQRQKYTLESYHAEMQREMEVARHIFGSITQAGEALPDCVKSWTAPASVLNGDLLISGRNPLNNLYLMLGDFTGHGLPAAVCAMPAADVFYTMTTKGYPVSDIVYELNKKLNTVLPTGLFCAGCLMEVDLAQGKISLWNGGLPEVVVIGSDGLIHDLLPSKAVPLGVVSDAGRHHGMTDIDIEPGMRLFFYTDGLIESENSQGEMYRKVRLHELFDGKTEQTELFDKILDDLKQFRGETCQSDDITLVELDCDQLISSMSVDNMPVYSCLEAPDCWSAEQFISGVSLKAADPIHVFIRMLEQHNIPEMHRSRICTVLSELISNSIEHGLLKLDSNIKNTADGFSTYYNMREKALEVLERGWIRVKLFCRPTSDGWSLSIHVEDNGEGFDAKNYLANMVEVESLTGRGVALIRSFCSEFSYNKTGNIARAVYCWK